MPLPNPEKKFLKWLRHQSYRLVKVLMGGVPLAISETLNNSRMVINLCLRILVWVYQ